MKARFTVLAIFSAIGLFFIAQEVLFDSPIADVEIINDRQFPLWVTYVGADQVILVMPGESTFWPKKVYKANHLVWKASTTKRVVFKDALEPRAIGTRHNDEENAWTIKF